MTDGSTLLKLQELDLALERDRAALADMPELKELARKRKAYLKLKSEMNKLVALRKDIETELEDLDEDERFCNAAIEQAQTEMSDPANYHAVQDFENQLAGISKRLDKIAFARKDAFARLEGALEKERYAAEYIAKFEATVVSETRAARERAGELQNSIEVSSARREALLNGMSAQLTAQYEAASKRFKGLFVERLEGNVPSVCRTALQPSSMDQLAHADELAECPYCHRILVLGSEDE